MYYFEMFATQEQVSKTIVELRFGEITVAEGIVKALDQFKIKEFRGDINFFCSQ